jgi:hypothetical protein
MIDTCSISFIYVIISLAIITVLTYLYITKKSSESFCTCRNMTNKYCPNPQVLSDLYYSGKLTESTDLNKIKKENINLRLPMPDDQFALKMGWF